MIRYAVLGSGSNGNSYIIESNGTSVLLDAGFSLRQIRERCASAGFDPSLISALFITHLHPDHSRGAGVIARQMNLPVYFHSQIDANHKELQNLRIPGHLHHTYKEYEKVSLGEFTIQSIPTSHDSPYSSGFRVSIGERTFILLTDTGMVNEEMSSWASDGDVLFLEANYDETMLSTGRYPYYLKQRIGGEKGHLSNESSIGFLNTLPLRTERHVFFCHLSLENNSPEALKRTIDRFGSFSGEHTICENGATYTGEIPPERMN